MKRMRCNIAWRMGLGFGVFILAVAVLFVFTRLTLTRSSELAAEVDSSLVPSLEALEDMDQTLASSLVYINNWIAEQSRADVEKKVMLRRPVNATFPQHLKALDGLELAWTPHARAHLDTLRAETDALLVLYGEIMRLLPDWKRNTPSRVPSSRSFPPAFRTDSRRSQRAKMQPCETAPRAWMNSAQS